MKSKSQIQIRSAERYRARQLKKDGPLFCKHESCVEFRNRDPKFAARLQSAGVIAHYMGKGGIYAAGGDYWMLSGITPVNRAGLENLMLAYRFDELGRLVADRLSKTKFPVIAYDVRNALTELHRLGYRISAPRTVSP